MKEVREIEGKYYFAYGSNMNLGQMAFRCPAAVVVENVRVEGYRLAFCGRPSGNGVATILPEEGSHVDSSCFNSCCVIAEPLSFRLEQRPVIPVRISVRLAVSDTGKAPCSGKPLTESADSAK